MVSKSSAIFLKLIVKSGIPDADTDGVILGVGVFDGVVEGVAVLVGVTVGVIVFVGVTVGVAVGVGVIDGGKYF
jgi:hypothetical protein